MSGVAGKGELIECDMSPGLLRVKQSDSQLDIDLGYTPYSVVVNLAAVVTCVVLAAP